jgi:hypothetical protein
VYCDAVYVCKIFDLLLGWNEAGLKSFVDVSSATLVKLGKLKHNAFQERVFSQGAHKDSIFKKSLKEENFKIFCVECVK